MILSGEKKEEYREIKSYWVKRLVLGKLNILDCKLLMSAEFSDYINEAIRFAYILFLQHNRQITHVPIYSIIHFTNGYSKNAPSFDIECLDISIGKGNKKWGAPDENTFIIRLGNIISTKNIPNDKK